MEKIKSVRSLKNLPVEELDSRKMKAWRVVETGKRCCLPSCQRSPDLDDLEKHHWTFAGREKEDLLFQPSKTHLLCLDCHDRVHRIAMAIVCFLEKCSSEMMRKLTKEVSYLVLEPMENVVFVLRNELEPAGIVKIRKGKCALVDLKDERIHQIKAYSPQTSLVKLERADELFRNSEA